MLTRQVLRQDFLQPCLRKDSFPAPEASPILSVSCNGHLTPFPIEKLALYYREDRPRSTVLANGIQCNGWSPGQRPSGASSDPVPVDPVFLTVTASVWYKPLTGISAFPFSGYLRLSCEDRQAKGWNDFIKAVSCCCSHYQLVSLSSCQPEPVHFP